MRSGSSLPRLRSWFSLLPFDVRFYRSDEVGRERAELGARDFEVQHVESVELDLVPIGIGSHAQIHFSARHEVQQREPVGSVLRTQSVPPLLQAEG